MNTHEREFDKRLHSVKADAVLCVAHTFQYLGFHQSTFRDPDRQMTVNTHPDFFLAMLNAHQHAYIIVLGRIYDTGRGVETLESLMNYTKDHPGIFSREALAHRKREGGMTEEQAAQFVHDAFEPNKRSFDALITACNATRATYNTRARALRHEVIAHTGTAPLQERIRPFDNFLVRDLERIAVLPMLIVHQLQHLFVNGLEPALQPVITNIVDVLAQQPGSGPAHLHVQVAQRAQKFVEEFTRMTLNDFQERGLYHREHPDGPPPEQIA